MNAFRITLAYDGTDFAGWQRQHAGTGVRTVQGVVEEALARLSGGQRVVVHGAGRTDAGVHAVGQVASFALPRAMEARPLARAMNALLPEDVRVLEAREVPPEFHARKSAVSKLYRYVLDTGPVQIPTRRRTAAHVPFGLDSAAVESVAALFLGRHDFAALASSGSSVLTTVRTVTCSTATLADGAWTFEFEADGFLRKMVRSMVGGLVAAGRGAATVDALRSALVSRERSRWPAPAEARGLILVRIDYPA